MSDLAGAGMEKALVENRRFLLRRKRKGFWIPNGTCVTPRPLSVNSLSVNLESLMSTGLWGLGSLGRARNFDALQMELQGRHKFVNCRETHTERERERERRGETGSGRNRALTRVRARSS